jgi:hypothetical protein
MLLFSSLGQGCRWDSGKFSYEITTHTMTIRTLPPKKETFVVRSHTLTPSTKATLRRLSSDATDTLGRAVSDSSIVRVLLRYADQQGVAWAREQLFPLIGQEMSSGILWGKKKR